MSVLHRTRSDSTGQNTAPAPAAPAAQDGAPAPAARDGAPAPAGTRAGSRTRLSTAWVSIWTATVVFIALIVFMLQNTRRVEVSFLGLHGTLPLALALLITAAGAVLLTLIFGTARITQLRRRLSRSRHS
jgi:putative membrane protein